MLRSATSKVMWVGRATVFMVGLSVMLALVLGVATTALAAIPGDPFRLGQTNGIDAMSTLVGNVAGTMLRVDNNSTGAGATALELRVEAGKASMKVNSATRVALLNADKVDGKDATAFYAAGSKVADSSHADTADTATSAGDANTLDGKDSTQFADSSHTHSGADITGGTVEADRIEDGQGSNLDADVLDGRDSSTYLPGNLPSGTTIRGTFGELDVAQSTNHGQYVAISFGYSVSPAPTAHYVVAGAPTPTGCTGSAANPGAQPGHLCIFESGSSNLAFRNVFIVESSGAVVALGPTTTNTYYAYGTWAVTAP